MTCPKCYAEMEKVTYGGVEVDRCKVCKGIWFDLGERETLKGIEGSQAIDSGDPEVGKRFNRLDRIDCPQCKTQMIRMVDAGQPHIWYEACSVCNGAFFDAGEFTDYKEETILDFFRDLRTKERR